MAVFKIFGEKDATIYSYYPSKNSGLDEILEVSLYKNSSGEGEVSRTLIKFPETEITDTINNLVTGYYSASIKLYLAVADSIPLDYSIYCYPISGAWSMGTGRDANLPTSSDGVSWKYQSNNNTQVLWPVTGGVWYSGSFESSQSFKYQLPKDVEIDVTNAVHGFYTGSIVNEGFIFKHSSSLEFNASQSFQLKYFSCDTHTIYPPTLEIKWNDFVYNTGSGLTVSTDKIVTSIKIKDEYQQDSVQKFRLSTRDEFPVRTFQTSSVYLTNKYLPTSSYWAIKDIDTEDYIIDFDETFTKISADANGNYFTVYMNGLQPERFYKLLIKSTISGSTVVFDNDQIFKVVR